MSAYAVAHVGDSYVMVTDPQPEPDGYGGSRVDWAWVVAEPGFGVTRGRGLTTVLGAVADTALDTFLSPTWSLIRAMAGAEFIPA